jgi:hypothetical protein
MTHRMGWPELICVTVAVLGVAMATAALVAGETTLAFLGVIGAGGAWAVSNALADAREDTQERQARRARVLDFAPDYETHQLLQTRVPCGYPECGAMAPIWEMDKDELLGVVCKRHRREAQGPKEVA